MTARRIHEAAALGGLAAIAGTLLAVFEGATPAFAAILGIAFGAACAAARLSNKEAP